MTLRRTITATLTTAALMSAAVLLVACGGSASTSSAALPSTAAPGTPASSALSPASPGTSVGTDGGATEAPPSADAIDQSGAATASSAASAAPSRSATAAAKATIVLEPDGLGFLLDGGTIRHLTFADADAASVKTALTTVLGTLKASDLPECGQGKRSSLDRDDFSVLLDGTKFVGWLDQGAKAHRTTGAGLGIGTTLAQLKKLESNVDVSTDTLGPEFFVENGISGFLDGTKPTSKVTTLYAGETCFFR